MDKMKKFLDKMKISHFKALKRGTGGALAR